MADLEPWAIIILVLLGCALLSVTVAGLGRLYLGDQSSTVDSRPSDIQAGYMREVRERNQMNIMHKVQRGPKAQRFYTNYTDYSSATNACKFVSSLIVER
jgi:arylamine N-acetyltransferase